MLCGMELERERGVGVLRLGMKEWDCVEIKKTDIEDTRNKGIVKSRWSGIGFSLLCEKVALCVIDESVQQRA